MLWCPMDEIQIETPFQGLVYHLRETTSTMDAARSLKNLKNSAHGTVVVADTQTKGRGKQGRKWVSEAGKNLLCTVILQYTPHMAPAALTLRIGLAVACAIEDLEPSPKVSDTLFSDTLFVDPPTERHEETKTPKKVQIKWPNDILINGKKLGGILCEGSDNRIFVGIGVNILQTEFPSELKDKTCSLVQAKSPTSSLPDRFTLLSHILFRMEEFLLPSYDSLWQPELESRLFRHKTDICFVNGTITSTDLIRGNLVGVGSQGELCILPTGETKSRSFTTGELLF